MVCRFDSGTGHGGARRGKDWTGKAWRGQAGFMKGHDEHS